MTAHGRSLIKSAEQKLVMNANRLLVVLGFAVRRCFFMVLIYAAVEQPALAGPVVGFGSFALSLPDGYTHEPRRGFDSQVGDISIKGRWFKIHYDTYGWEARKLSEYSKERLDSVIYYARYLEGTFRTSIVALESGEGRAVVVLEVIGLGSFHTEPVDRAALKDTIAVVRAISVTKDMKQTR